MRGGDDVETGSAPIKSRRGTSVARSAARVLAVLETLAGADRPLTIPEISARAGLPKATAHRMLLLLRMRQWTRQLPDGKGYTLGLWGFVVARATLERFTVREVARPYLDELVEKTGQTLLLGAICDDRLVYLDRRDGRSVLRVASQVGQLREPTYGILGKLLLAYLPRPVAERYLKEFPPQATARNAITDPQRFLAELDRVRRQGWAMAVEETHNGVAGVAAPIFDASGEVVAGLALLCATPLLSEGELEEYRDAVVATARSISVALGWAGGHGVRGDQSDQEGWS